MFVCLPCHRLPKSEPQECEITSTRGISRLYRAEKGMFLSDNSVHFHPGQTLFISHKPLHICYLKPHTIKQHHYIYIYIYIGSHGYSVSRFAYVTSLACFIAVINGTWCIVRKRQTARFLFGVVGTLTENQCSVSHEHLISWTLVHC